MNKLKAIQECRTHWIGIFLLNPRKFRKIHRIKAAAYPAANKWISRCAFCEYDHKTQFKYATEDTCSIRRCENCPGLNKWPTVTPGRKHACCNLANGIYPLWAKTFKRKYALAMVRFIDELLKVELEKGYDKNKK
jgi:hypothetical protein